MPQWVSRQLPQLDPLAVDLHLLKRDELAAVHLGGEAFELDAVAVVQAAPAGLDARAETNQLATPALEGESDERVRARAADLGVGDDALDAGHAPLDHLSVALDCVDLLALSPRGAL